MKYFFLFAFCNLSAATALANPYELQFCYRDTYANSSFVLIKLIDVNPNPKFRGKDSALTCLYDTLWYVTSDGKASYPFSEGIGSCTEIQNKIKEADSQGKQIRMSLSIDRDINSLVVDSIFIDNQSQCLPLYLLTP